MVPRGTNRDLLLSVKEHAYKVPGSVPPSAVSGSTHDGKATWEAADWRRTFEGLFLEPESRDHVQSQEADDLMFFVWASGVVKDKADSFTVRRWARSIPRELSDTRSVDWYRTCFLNLIVHTNFALTLAVCRRSDSQPAVSEPVVQTRSRVYASPSYSPVSIDTSSRTALAHSPEPCWPDISFSVSNFDEEFESMVVAREDCCFCVILALATDEQQPVTVESQQPGSSVLPGEIAFSGLVTYPQLQGAMAGGGGLMSLLFGEVKTRKVVMRGPGGQGKAEVAVTKLDRQAPQRTAGGKPALRCCLMDLSLPWESLAACILRTI